MTSRESYDRALALFRQFGRGVVGEFRTGQAEPTMMATLTVQGVTHEEAANVAADMVTLAVVVRGYMSLVVHDDEHGQHVSLSLHVTRAIDQQDAAVAA